MEAQAGVMKIGPFEEVFPYLQYRVFVPSLGPSKERDRSVLLAKLVCAILEHPLFHPEDVHDDTRRSALHQSGA